MGARFQELDRRPTTLGELVLRRRWDPVADREVHEIKLDDEFLMSSLFTAAEEELARLALAGMSAPLDVVVGGLGLGYTARTVLADPNVRSLLVVDALDAVIDWHRRGLVPGGTDLAEDPRCTLAHGDFFALARSPEGFDPEVPHRRFHAVIVDIDHSPRHLLHPDNADFYQPAGIARLADRLHPGGVFALWSNDPPDEDCTAALSTHFAHTTAEVVRFPNPLQGGESTNTVYLATTATD
ncbi:spermidine synthase [Actinosynnema sp. NPDC050436]|uniref:spermine/spermidine synthase domain-containing protein n=1 Tax=Actinosynnema sp. NPDC050436 TaxID=3155659 RepID=UPI0034035D39